MTVTPDDIRHYANLPLEVPGSLLTRHLQGAVTDLKHRTGLNEPPSDKVEIWDEALIVKTLAHAYPWLNTFAMDGASKIGRLEGAIEARFLDADETDSRVERLNNRYNELVARLESEPHQLGIHAI